MCYASPGPRCETHAKERHTKLQAKTVDSWQKVRDIEKEMFKVEENYTSYEEARSSKEYQSLAKKRTALFDKWKSHSDAAIEAKEEIDATRGGIKALRTEIAKTMNDGSTEAAMHRDYLMKRLDKGTEKFNKKMLEYDMKKGTVDGRDPSPYGDDEGVQKLREKTRTLKEKYDNAPDYAKREAAYAEYTRSDNALDHAVKTRDYAKRGVINPYRASLNTNYEKVQKYTAEYKDIQAKQSESDKVYAKTVSDINAVKRGEYEAGRKAESLYSPEAKKKIRDLQLADEEHNKAVRYPLHKAKKEVKEKLDIATNEWNLGKKHLQNSN